ncbi:MAG: SdiA-regulated domain-containing protein [Gammaproteobacteria bacterium]|nr:SdiA-regulated domain-containing protein [Gammaproteobacteria bacterium]
MNKNKRRTKRLIWLFLALVLLLSWVSWHFPDNSPLSGIESEWDLTQYHPVGKTIRIEGIDDNLSGLTYHPPSGHLYAVTNKPRQIHILTKTGELVRSIKLDGFRDTESIAYGYDNYFFIAEEQRQNLVKIEVPDHVNTVNYSDATIYHIDVGHNDNHGLEGVAWSQQFGLFAVQEKPPLIIYQPTESHDFSDTLKALSQVRLNVRDFAGMEVLPGKVDKLLILSESSDSLHVVDMQGNELSRLSLRSDPFGLLGWFWQPEGVAVDDEGVIYIVGEANQFLALKRQ